VWENIPAPPPENPLVAQRRRAVADGLDRFLAITERARLHLELAGVPPERIDVLPMGIDVEHFAPAEDPVPAEPFRVLTVARLVPEKGVEDLVIATRLLRDRGTDVQVTLVGDGPLRGRLARLARELGVADRVVLRGAVAYGDMPDTYRTHDAFVLASAARTTWREQFGFAVVEAMACGLPVLAGSSGSLDEVVGDPEQLVPPHDPLRLATALQRLVAEPETRRRRGEENRRRALERYDRRKVAERLRAFYDRVLDAPARD
jgi:glycosyltransferase involved in cell wall biosynthesis